MIRNVVVGRLKDGVAPEEVEPALQALRHLTVDGVEFTLVGASISASAQAPRATR
jgi:hypothetical protein